MSKAITIGVIGVDEIKKLHENTDYIKHKEHMKRMAWLNLLETAVAIPDDEELPVWAFERTKEMTD